MQVRRAIAEWQAAHPDRIQDYRARERAKRGTHRASRPVPTDVAEVAWTAGILDGEGCIHIIRCRPRRNEGKSGRPVSAFRYVLRVQVGGTDEAMIKQLHSLWGGTRSGRGRRLKSGRLAYTWTVGSLRAEQVLRALRPYLITKAAQADVALEFRRTALRHPELGAKFREELKRLRLPPQFE